MKWQTNVLILWNFKKNSNDFYQKYAKCDSETAGTLGDFVFNSLRTWMGK